MTGARSRRIWACAAPVAALVLFGCGDGGSPVDKSAVTLTVPVEGSPERQLLSHIYAQALKGAGYRVKTAAGTQQTETAFDGVQAGRLSGFPEYMSTALFYEFGFDVATIPRRARVAHAELRRELAREDLTAFPPAPYGIANVVGMLRSTAERRGLKTNSDLKGTAERMTIKGPSYCHVSVECVGGIEIHYDTAFESITYERARTPELTWWRAEPEFRYRVLENGEVDASILFNTDGRLATEGDRFVVLEDDRRIFPASNFVWVTSDEVIDEAGPDYEKAIVEAQRGLALAVVRRLNAKLEAGKQPAGVAAEYLDSISYGR